MEILSLGEKIRRKRKSLRLTLKDVAGDNVTPAQLSYVESNKCKPSSNLLRYICSKIELDMEYALESECDQASKYCDYYLKEYEFYIKRGELKEALNKLVEIEKFALEYQLDRYLGIVAYNRSVDFIAKKDYDSAESSLLVALQIFMRFNDIGYIYNSYHYLGVVALKKNYLNDALEFYKRSLEIGQKIDANIGYYSILLDMAKVYHKMGSRDEAVKQLSKVITWVSNHIDDVKELGLIMEIPALSAEIFSSSGFEKYMDDFMSLYKAKKYLNAACTLDILKAVVCIKEQDYTTGMELLYRFFSKADDKVDEYQLVYLLRIAFILHNVHPDYRDFILSKIDSINMDKEQYALLLYLKSQVDKDNDSAKAVELLIKARNINEGSNNKHLSVLINNELGHLYKKEKKYQESFQCLLKSAQLLSMHNSAYYELNLF